MELVSRIELPTSSLPMNNICLRKRITKRFIGNADNFLTTLIYIVNYFSELFNVLFFEVSIYSECNLYGRMSQQVLCSFYINTIVKQTCCISVSEYMWGYIRAQRLTCRFIDVFLYLFPKTSEPGSCHHFSILLTK